MLTFIKTFRIWRNNRNTPVSEYSVIRNMRLGQNFSTSVSFNPLKLYTYKGLMEHMKSNGKILEVYWDDFKLWKNKRSFQEGFASSCLRKYSRKALRRKGN